jgi:hypothetical protein
MRYLLDELMTYEEGFGNMLMSGRAPERHETFMAASNPGDVASKHDLLMLEVSLVERIQHMLGSCSSIPENTPKKHQSTTPGTCILLCSIFFP